MKRFPIFFSFLMLAIATVFVPAQSHAQEVRQDYLKKLVVFSTTTAGAIDSCKAALPKGTCIVLKHTTSSIGTGAPTALLDSVTLQPVTAYQKNGDELVVMAITNGTARKVKRSGTSFTAAAYTLVPANKTYIATFRYTGTKWHLIVDSSQ